MMFGHHLSTTQTPAANAVLMMSFMILRHDKLY